MLSIFPSGFPDVTDKQDIYILTTENPEFKSDKSSQFTTFL